MKYKALFLDLDGTTVMHGMGQATDRVVEAVAKAKDMMHVCIATGRLLDTTLPIIKQLELTAPCVVGNGIQVYDPKKNEVVYEVGVDVSIIPQVYEIAQQYEVEMKIVTDREEMLYDGGDLPEKILSVYVPEIIPDKADDISHALGKLQGVSVHKMIAWDENFMAVDVVNESASKLHGIVQVQKLLNISKDEIIGVGDSYNDFPLLMASGLRIAMRNAVSELKDIADFIGPSVADDGVAVIIEKFLI